MQQDATTKSLYILFSNEKCIIINGSMIFNRRENNKIHCVYKIYERGSLLDIYTRGVRGIRRALVNIL